MTDLIGVIAERIKTRDEAEGRIYGAYPGSVTDVLDPMNLGRVKARILGQQPHEQSDWLCPMWPGAIESVPRPKDPIWVMFAGGDPNRGCYLCFPISTTTGRAIEAMVLGNAAIGMHNDLVDRFNALKSKVNELIEAFNYHTHVISASGTDSRGDTVTVIGSGAAPSAAVAYDFDDDAAKGLNHNGVPEPSISTAKIVLSGEAKVR